MIGQSLFPMSLALLRPPRAAPPFHRLAEAPASASGPSRRDSVATST
jgi:hypothetical protein